MEIAKKRQGYDGRVITSRRTIYYGPEQELYALWVNVSTGSVTISFYPDPGDAHALVQPMFSTLLR